MTEYNHIFENAISQLREQINKEFDSPEFSWNLLINLFLEEDSNLSRAFSS